MRYSLTFPSGTVEYLFQSSAEALGSLAAPENFIFITDSNVVKAQPQFFEGRKTIVIPAGEEHKNWESIQRATEQLINFEAHKGSCIIGIGGGVITDVTGFIGSVYMRGIPFGFMPTSLLGMVDAAIGGKNGINADMHKNMLGVIQQPRFILFDTELLSTLPHTEWSNGFAEVIKYACLFDEQMLEELEANDIDHYRKDKSALQALILRCVNLKNETVLEDEKEQNQRKLLNFGHTAGHALETTYHIPHGQAVAIGMVIACRLSEKVCGLSGVVTEKLLRILKQYDLSTYIQFDAEKVMDVLMLDKKRRGNTIDYILLNRPGNAEIMKLPFDIIKQALSFFADAGNHTAR